MATMVMYTPVLRHVARAEVTALCDPFPSALEQVRAYFPSAAMFLDFDEFLREARVDALIVATPVDLHRDQVVTGARDVAQDRRIHDHGCHATADDPDSDLFFWHTLQGMRCLP
jgi:hypothetical protein